MATVNNLIKSNPLNLQFSKDARVADLEWLINSLSNTVLVKSVEVEILHSTLDKTDCNLELFRDLTRLAENRLIEIDSLKQSIDKLEQELSEISK